MNNKQALIIELMIRKKTLKDVEIWLNQQYYEIQKAIDELEEK